MAKKTTKKASDKVVEESKEVVQEVPVQKQNGRKLRVTLGGTLKEGDTVTDEQLKDLLGAGFTEEQLFGKQ